MVGERATVISLVSCHSPCPHIFFRCPLPQDCSVLQECVQDFIDIEVAASDEDRNQGFLTYLADSARITDPTDISQCQEAREYFGFDGGE